MLSGHNAGCWVTIHNYQVFPAAAGGVNIWYKLPTTRQAGYLQHTTLQPRLSRRIEDGWHTGGPPAPPWRWTWGRAGAWPRWGPWRPAWSGPSTAPRWCRSLPHNIHPCTHCRYRAVKVSTNCCKSYNIYFLPVVESSVYKRLCLKDNWVWKLYQVLSSK